MFLTIKGNPATKKNHSQVVTIAGRPRLIPSKSYREYEKAALVQIPASARIGQDMPVTLKCTYFMQTRRRVDLNNLIAATADILVKAGVLADDNCRIVYSLDGSRVRYDKDFPRAEIEITPIGRMT